MFGLNQLKPVYFSRRLLATEVGIPVLGAVSVIMSPVEISRRKRGAALWAGANLLLFGAGVMAIALNVPISQYIRSFAGNAF